MCTVVARQNSKSGLVRGYVNPILSHFCLFLRFSVFFLSFPHWNRVIFGLYLVQSILVQMFTVVALGKFKILVHQGVHKPFLSQFCLFSEILCLFLRFSTLETCYIWLVTSLEYPSAYVYSVCLGKFKIGVGQGVRKPYFQPFLPIF